MFYEYCLTIPANTLAIAPVNQEVELDHGRIVAVEVQFPRGCRGLVHVQVRRELHQLWPTNTDGDLAGEDARIGWVEDMEFTEEPYTLTLRGWSPGTEFEHTITFRFNVLPISPPPAAPVLGLEYTPLGVMEV